MTQDYNDITTCKRDNILLLLIILYFGGEERIFGPYARRDHIII